MGHKLSKRFLNTDNNKKCFWVAYQHIRMIFLTISTQIVKQYNKKWAANQQY